MDTHLYFDFHSQDVYPPLRAFYDDAEQGLRGVSMSLLYDWYDKVIELEERDGKGTHFIRSKVISYEFIPYTRVLSDLSDMLDGGYLLNSESRNRLLSKWETVIMEAKWFSEQFNTQLEIMSFDEMSLLLEKHEGKFLDLRWK